MNVFSFLFCCSIVCLHLLLKEFVFVGDHNIRVGWWASGATTNPPLNIHLVLYTWYQVFRSVSYTHLTLPTKA